MSKEMFDDLAAHEQDFVHQMALAIINHGKEDEDKISSLEQQHYTSTETQVGQAIDAYRAIEGMMPVGDNSTTLHWKVATLFDAIKHGDAEHQEWLRNKINEHFMGYASPPKSGSAEREKLKAIFEKHGRGQPSCGDDLYQCDWWSEDALDILDAICTEFDLYSEDTNNG